MSRGLGDVYKRQQVTTRAVAQTGGSGNEGEDDDKGSGGGSDGGGSGEAPDPAA